MSVVSTNNGAIYCISPKARTLSESIENLRTQIINKNDNTLYNVFNNENVPLPKSPNLQRIENTTSSSKTELSYMFSSTMTIQQKKYNIAKSQISISTNNVYPQFEQDLITGCIIYENDPYKIIDMISNVISLGTDIYIIYFTLLVQIQYNKYVKFEIIQSPHSEREQRHIIYVLPTRKKDFKKLIYNIHHLFNNTIQIVFENLPTKLFFSKIKC